MTKRAREAGALFRMAVEKSADRQTRCVIEGIYHPHLADAPGSLSIECAKEWLGQTYLTSIGGFLAEVSMPRLDRGAGRVGLAAPSFTLLDGPQDWSDCMFPGEPQMPKWGLISGSRAIVREFRVAVDPGETDPADACEAVREAIGDWWRLVKAWFEVLSSQDLEGADRFHWSNGSLSLWYRDPEGDQRSPLGRSWMRNQWRPNMGFGATHALAIAFHAAGCGHAPPLEWQLLREALRAFERSQFRRVLIEAGMAAELALTIYLTRAKRLPKGQSPLGGLVSAEELAGDASILPQGFRELVLDERNHVMHRAKLPSADDATAAFQLTMKVVEAASPRQQVTEPYGLITRTDPYVDSRGQGGPDQIRG